MAQASVPIHINDLSGGMSDEYPAIIAENQIVEGWDVEFWDGNVAARRNGCTSVVTSITQGHLMTVFTPTEDRTDDRLTVACLDGTFRVFDSSYGTASLTTNPADNLDPSTGVDWASLHGKLFIACKSDEDRLHVHDNTGNIRRTGLAEPAAPSVANQGAGAFVDDRQYRVRYTVQSGGETILRSEPSTATAFSPSGTGASARITKPAGLGEGETHWEVEEIAPSGDWYRIATVAVGTTTYDDSLALSAVASTGILSADVGDYALQGSAKWLTVDEDRLVLGSSFEDENLSATVVWTPIGSSQTGVGNDERLPADVDGRLDFDTLDGGGLTGIKAWNGKVIVFKDARVHQMTRTGSLLRAYLPGVLSRIHGALPYSIVEGVDERGLSCLYFLDRRVGPMRLGVDGLRVLAPQLQRRWRETINFDALHVSRAVYSSNKQQVWWHVATGVADFPNVRWMFSVMSGGFVMHTVPGLIYAAVEFNGFPHLLQQNGGNARLLKADDPAATSDNDVTFRAYVRTRAYQRGGVFSRWQVNAAVLEAAAEPGVSVSIKAIRDFGREDRSVSVSLTPAGSEEFVTQPVDNSYMTEAVSMQFEIGDASAVAVAAWRLYGLTLLCSLGSPTTGYRR